MKNQAENKAENKADNVAQNVVVPESLDKKRDRIFIHQEKKREEPECYDGIE